MTTRYKSLAKALLCGFIALGAMQFVHSDGKTLQNSQQTEIEQITVTAARKKQENLQSSPIAMTAVTSTAINHFGLTDVAQLEQFSPNPTQPSILAYPSVNPSIAKSIMMPLIRLN